MSDLLNFLKPDETAAQFLARTHVEPVSTGLFFAASIRPGQALEICGPSGTAKSEILIQVTATRILSKHWQGLHVGGHSEHIVLYDLDRKFDGIRLYHVLLTRLRNLPGQQQLKEGDVNAAAKEAFGRFHLVQCSSSYNLLAALKTADDLISACEETGSIKMLLLDNIAAFYWLDRATTELPEYAHDTERDAQVGLQQAHACIAAELSKLLKERRLALIATRHSALSAGGFDRGEPVDVWAYREFLPKPWQDLITMRVLVKGQSYSTRLRPAASPQAQGLSCITFKWQMPHAEAAQGFAVTDHTLVPC